MLGAGYGMRGNEVAGDGAEGLSRCGQHAALGAADVADNGLAAETGSHGAHHAAHGTQRHRQHHHVGTLYRFGRIQIVAIDDSQLAGTLEILAPAAATDDGTAQSLATQILRERSADEADADDAQAFDHAPAMTCPSPGPRFDSST